jgi:rifampicin phosphotransferase
MAAGSFAFCFRDIGHSKHKIVGGKGANLGELTKIEGIHVPDGFCISTEAFRKSIGEVPSIRELLNRLSPLKAGDRDKIGALSGEIRRVIEGMAIPGEISEEIIRLLSRLGEKDAYAVRSSATAEDSPTASFAGQHDTYLNIIGTEAILNHIGKCWASLYTERAIIYRLQNGFDHGRVDLSVIVQRMVFPQAAGILFTADPLSGNRTVSSIDAGFGLGEAVVSGLVNADNYRVRNGKVIGKKISAKKLAIHALKDGGTREREIEPSRRNAQVLTDGQVSRLEGIGRRIEGHFGRPQDIEWCLADGLFHIVQSRPITTLYPIPEADDGANRVYISVGHQQMMTDAMKPLGLSFFLLTTRAPMRKAGGRLFVDVAPILASPAGRKTFLDSLGQADPLIKDALTTYLGREATTDSPPEEKKESIPGKSNPVISTAGFRTQVKNDPAMVSGLIEGSQAAIAELKRTIQSKAGPDLFDFILEDIQRLKAFLTHPQSLGVILAAMDASSWINEKMDEWLGEKKAADTLSQSVPDNITSEMGLALLDVADIIRPYPEVAAYLQQAEAADFWSGLEKLEGGPETRQAIRGYLDRYGMRCAGEIDITKTRWSEKPAILVPMILSNIRNLEPGAGKRKFEQGRREALEKAQGLLTRLRRLPDGEEKAEETERMIDLIRNFLGYREYPKYAMISRYFVYKQALLKEADRLLQAGVIREKEDIFYLTFEELREAVRTGKSDDRIIGERKDEHKSHERLPPPRVITSDGEIIAGEYKRENLPAGAMMGLAVSSGVIEGRGRVILTMEEADLEDGDILVTPFTDPSWTPLFVSIKGLVTEVGGLMTHGAVIAREYGLPAVVGVENATKRIKDGQRIRVHGTEGYVEIL